MRQTDRLVREGEAGHDPSPLIQPESLPPKQLLSRSNIVPLSDGTIDEKMNRLLGAVIIGIALIEIRGGYALIGFPGMMGSPLVEAVPEVHAETLAKHLGDRAMNVELSRSVKQVFFSVEAMMLRVNGDDIQVFYYPSRARAQEVIGTVTPKGQFSTVMVTWITTSLLQSR